MIRLDPIFDWLNRNSPIWILTPWPSNIGNCAEMIYFGLLKARRTQKKVVLLHRRQLSWKLKVPVANHELYNLESPYSIAAHSSKWRLIAEWLLTAVYGPYRGFHLVSAAFLRILQKLCRNVNLPHQLIYSIPMIGESDLWRPEGVKTFSWERVKELRWQEQYSDYLPINISEDRLQTATNIRKKLGIPESDWFACFHIREGGFRQDWEVKSHLLCTVENYFEGMKAITDAGGWVVRLGDSTMTPLPKMNRVLDYPHSEYKSPLMDIYFASQCSFFVGVNSGPLDLPWLFQKPMVVTNASEWNLHFPPRNGDFIIFKHIFSNSLNRYLSLEEMLKETSLCQSDPFPNRSEYTFVENTSAEIRSVVEEFLQKPSQFVPSPSQQKFNQKMRYETHRWLDGEVSVPEERVLDAFAKYRIAARTDSCAGVVGQRYLDQNWSTDSFN